ncbi:MAG TPA: class I SAM-dependent methyltransferase, partial [bacterium]|nr:class I SAM-dependent methyltransferase [bacterium]
PEKRVGWKTAESQRVRFEEFNRVGSLKGSKILDVGCGLGAFWGYLQEKEIPVRYTGIDLFPEVIQEARRFHPNVKFEVRHILARPYPARSFDYSFLSGVFNIKVKNSWIYMKAMLKQSLRQTKKAVAFNVLNAESGLEESNRFVVTPREITALGRSLGVKKTHLLDHYHHLDLTLFLYR